MTIIKKNFFFTVVQNLLLFLVFLAALGSCQGRSAEDRGQSFCIQTLNTYGNFYAENLEERHERILNFLQKNECNAVLLQEVLYLNHYDNFSRLFLDSGMNSMYFNEMSKNVRISGLASLVRGHIQASGMEFFPESIYNGFFENTFNLIKIIDKGFGYVQTRFPAFDHYPFLIINIHLHHFSKRMRIKQLLFYLQWLLSIQPFDGVIISAGDFNFIPKSLEYDMIQYLFKFQDSFKEVSNRVFCTFLCEGSDEIIRPLLIGGKIKDYIFFNTPQNLEMKVQKAGVFPKKKQHQIFSDHYGVEAVFHVQEKLRAYEPGVLEQKVDRRREQFQNTLKKVESFLNEEPSSFGFKFIQSLKKDLNHPDSRVMHYLNR